jgi:hypothetical protein
LILWKWETKQVHIECKKPNQDMTTESKRMKYRAQIVTAQCVRFRSIQRVDPVNHLAWLALHWKSHAIDLEWNGKPRIYDVQVSTWNCVNVKRKIKSIPKFHSANVKKAAAWYRCDNDEEVAEEG